MDINRRSLITGLVSFIAAPAIIRATSLMPINAGLVPDSGRWSVRLFWAEVDTTRLWRDHEPIPIKQIRLNGLPICRADGEPVAAGELVAGETYSFSPLTGRLVR
jgi:hypothetical protein